jgi:hypothetical protein
MEVDIFETVGIVTLYFCCMIPFGFVLVWVMVGGYYERS